MRWTVATVPGTPHPVPFDRVLPGGAKNNITGRLGLWRAKHFEGVEMIELLMFAGAPLIPSAERLKLPVGKSTNGLLCGCNRLGLDGMKDHFNFFSRDM